MTLPAHTRERIDEIVATHVPARRSPWEWLTRAPARCVLCAVPMDQCLQWRWMVRVLSGQIAPAGWGVPPVIPQQRPAPRPVRAAAWWEV